MNFADAFLAMTHGERVRLPWWRGYWYMNEETIYIHTPDGKDCDIRQTEDFLDAVAHMTSDSWQLVPDGGSILNDLQQEMNELCKT